MANWYSNTNWFIFVPHGHNVIDKFMLFECTVQKGRIEPDEFKLIDGNVDDPKKLMGNHSWALPDFIRLSRYIKPKHMAVNSQGICYARLYPKDMDSNILDRDRFWLRVFDLFPLDLFGLTPKALTERTVQYIELNKGDPSRKGPPPAPSKRYEDKISDLNDTIKDLQNDRDYWRKKYDKCVQDHKDDDKGKNVIPPPPVKPSESDLAFERGLILYADVMVEVGVIPFITTTFGVAGVNNLDYGEVNQGDGGKGQRIRKGLCIYKAYKEWRYANLGVAEVVMSRSNVKVVRGSFLMWRAL